MSRLLNGSTEWLRTAAAIASVTPLTLACWFWLTDSAAARVIMCIDDGTANERFQMNHNIGGAIAALVANAGTTSQATTVATASSSAWHHGAAVFASATSRSIYLDGGNVQSNATSRTPGALNSTTIGARNGGGTSFAGYLAEVAIWNAALTAAEAALLGLTRVSPLMIRSANLVAYAPLMGQGSPEIDIVRGNQFALTGTKSGGPAPVVPLSQAATIPRRYAGVVPFLPYTPWPQLGPIVAQ